MRAGLRQQRDCSALIAFKCCPFHWQLNPQRASPPSPIQLSRGASVCGACLASYIHVGSVSVLGESLLNACFIMLHMPANWQLPPTLPPPLSCPIPTAALVFYDLLWHSFIYLFSSFFFAFLNVFCI